MCTGPGSFWGPFVGPRTFGPVGHLGQGPCGPGPIWPLHGLCLGQGPFGPGPIWARASSGPGPFGPCSPIWPNCMGPPNLAELGQHGPYNSKGRATLNPMQQVNLAPKKKLSYIYIYTKRPISDKLLLFLCEALTQITYAAPASRCNEEPKTRHNQNEALVPNIYIYIYIYVYKVRGTVDGIN